VATRSLIFCFGLSYLDFTLGTRLCNKAFGGFNSFLIGFLLSYLNCQTDTNKFSKIITVLRKKHAFFKLQVGLVRVASADLNQLRNQR